MIEESIAVASTPLFPYSDGSGFEIVVRVEEHDADELRVIIRHLNDTIYVSADRWPEMRSEIDRLVAFMQRNAPPSSPANDKDR